MGRAGQADQHPVASQLSFIAVSQSRQFGVFLRLVVETPESTQGIAPDLPAEGLGEAEMKVVAS